MVVQPLLYLKFQINEEAKLQSTGKKKMYVELSFGDMLLSCFCVTARLLSIFAKTYIHIESVQNTNTPTKV